MADSVRLDSLCVDNLAAFALVVVFIIIDLSDAMDGAIVDEVSSLLVVGEFGNMFVVDGLKTIGVGALGTFSVVGMPVIVVVLVWYNGLSVDELEDFAILEESFILIDSVESGGMGVEGSGLFVITLMPEVFGEFFAVVTVEGILVVGVVGEVIAPYDVWTCFTFVVAGEAFQDKQII